MINSVFCLHSLYRVYSANPIFGVQYQVEDRVSAWLHSLYRVYSANPIFGVQYQVEDRVSTW